jgi:CheY-like chemotaxis protein
MTGLNNITILVVDDDPLIAHDIVEILKEVGYNAIEPSHTYLDAVDSLRSETVHLAVLDINLGSGKTGIDIATHIKENYQLPYIFLTSYSDDATLEAAQEVSPYGYLVKPFQPPTLLSTIKIALSNHSKLAERKGW